MRKILIATFALGISTLAAATLTPQTNTFVSQNGITLPDPFLPNQQTGLNWMVKNGCSRGDHTVGGIPITCSGDKVSDVNNYLAQVAITNLYNVVIK